MFEEFLNDVQSQQLKIFHAFFSHENRTGFLSSIRNEQDIFNKHYADCFIAGKMLAEKGYLQSPLVDLGSGGGFPGIPLKIQYPHLEIILAECRQSKARFLQQAIAKLELSQVSVFSKKVTAKSFDLPFRTVLTRALEPISETLERFATRAQKTSLFIFMKGPDVDREMVSFGKNSKLAGQFVIKDRLHYALPVLGHSRTLIVIEKV